MQNYRSGGQRWIHDSPLKRDETGSDGKVLVKLQVCNVYDARLSTSPLARFEFPLSVEEGDSLPPRLFTSSALTSLGERIHFPSAPLMDFKNDRAPNLFFNKESNSKRFFFASDNFYRKLSSSKIFSVRSTILRL